ncbi:MAG TPA: hypothetical protein VHM16_05285, partial [Rubrobacteraceae bacterium]|nr:hypothetical protein [Rubrobacteraceae bacterium]
MTVSARQLGSVLVSLLAAAALLAFSTAARSEPPEDLIDGGPGGSQHAAGELIVTFKDDAPEQEIESLDEEVGAEVEESLSGVDAKVLDFPEVKAERSEEVREEDLQQAKQELERDPAVENVYYNHVRTGFYTPNDPRFRYQYGLRKPSFEKAWNRTRGGGARVAIVDSGVDVAHPDFRR